MPNQARRIDNFEKVRKDCEPFDKVVKLEPDAVLKPYIVDKTPPKGDTVVSRSLINILIEQAQRENDIIAQIKSALASNDKDKVVELARRLT